MSLVRKEIVPSAETGVCEIKIVIHLQLTIGSQLWTEPVNNKLVNIIDRTQCLSLIQTIAIPFHANYLLTDGCIRFK